MNATTKLATIDTLLAGVPQFQCVEGCHDCCGPVVMSRLERKRILERTSKTEKQHYNEMMAAVESAIAASEVEALHGNCPLLGEHGCTVYDIRPAICRVFGATEHHRLICPHGRKPEAPMSAKATDTLIDEVNKLGY